MENNVRFMVELGRMVEIAISLFLGKYENEVDWDILISNDIVGLVEDEEDSFYIYVTFICDKDFKLIFCLDNDECKEIRSIALWHGNNFIDEWEQE